MASLFLQSEQQHNVWSVSDVTAYIRELFDIDVHLQDVQVSGEISNYRPARSGHIYFTLKDTQSQIPCVMWRSDVARMRHQPEDGDAVVIQGRISVFEAGGRYQLYAERITPAGRGDLAAAFERLKAKLEAEGLFEAEYKQPLPLHPSKVGIVTSIDAAALRDILNVLRRRYPLVQILIAPTLVQGNNAPPQIVRALQWLDGRDDIDVIIMARGGGSLEDLWAFNDEQVARAIFAAQHPIICGIGHETDFSIADFVADVRAPTPSAAAEIVVPDRRELLAGIDAQRKRQEELLQSLLARERLTVVALERNLAHLGPVRKLTNDRQRVDALSLRLDQAMRFGLSRAWNEFSIAETKLDAVGPLATLARGYAIVRHPDGKVVHSANAVQAGDRVHIQVSEGAFDASVIKDDD